MSGKRKLNVCNKGLVPCVTELDPVLRKELSDALGGPSAEVIRCATFIFQGPPAIKCPYTNPCNKFQMCLLPLFPHFRDTLKAFHISEEAGSDPAEVWIRCKHNKEEIKDGRS